MGLSVLTSLRSSGSIGVSKGGMSKLCPYAASRPHVPWLTGSSLAVVKT